MMRRTLVKIAVLTMLSVLCIWQMATLWLGDMSGHNFLGKNGTVHNIILVQPKMMWVNTGSFAYKVEESKREYTILIDELINLVLSNAKSISLEKNDSLQYEDLLKRQGIFYEYDLPITLQELVGVSFEKLPNDITMTQVFADMSVYNDYRTDLYLITKDLNDIYKVSIYNRLEAHRKVVEGFNNTQITDSLMNYHASLTSVQSSFIKNNNFLPFNTEEKPLEYEVLTVSNPIEEKEGQEKIEALEYYVNWFFANPLLKQVAQREDGSIIFSETMGASVKYDPVGTLEFNITSANQEMRLDQVARLTKVMQFIESCRGIPEGLKKGIYLSEIVSDNEDYIYKFNYKYKGFSMHLTDKVKEVLGLSHVLEITIRNNQVVRGKWSMLEMDAKEGEMGRITRGFNEIVTRMYEYYVKNKYEIKQLDVIQCRYVLNATHGDIKLSWLVLYNNRWYYP